MGTQKRYAILACLLLVFVVIISAFSIFVSLKEELVENSEIQVKIERIDCSIKNDEGTVLAIIYYDKPLAIGNSDAVIKINTFFERDYQEWVTGVNRLNKFTKSSMSEYLDRVKEMREFYGDSFLEKQPLFYTVGTEITLSSQKFISVKQTVCSFSGGSSGRSYYGTTFDAHTGERISFDNIIDIDADTFRENLSCYLIDLVSMSDVAVRRDWELHIKSYYGPNEVHNYDTYINGNLYQLNYEYYYDGEYFYIPDNSSGYTRGTSDIIKWNGKVGDAFKASLLEGEKYFSDL